MAVYLSILGIRHHVLTRICLYAEVGIHVALLLPIQLQTTHETLSIMYITYMLTEIQIQFSMLR